ncbi:hypothetical protein AMAG_05747 [Allomyces macrogynus ATCC 38327]|uniref:Uncharacterized protein n=1 Tax=Allomyces macrogynus (strain ATCC 38327) TaxID=578462 RepID=A0A0L0SD67_ALLM3|nr:hypothetical protein AMAG_05747 [Allomyces macrogynus ATCC 38327]|eukprot:KNE60350.1 hypothetical protein AMAG_05747 [Allomyces macrogynus ATCC 38327]
MLFDTVVMQLFLYPDLRGVRDLIRKRRTLGTTPRFLFEPFHDASIGAPAPTPPKHVDRRMLVEDLTFKATLVLIEYPTGMDPFAAMSATVPTRAQCPRLTCSFTPTSAKCERHLARSLSLIATRCRVHGRRSCFGWRAGVASRKTARAPTLMDSTGGATGSLSMQHRDVACIRANLLRLTARMQ